MTMTIDTAAGGPAIGEPRLMRLMQALDDALIFRRARSMSLCMDCAESPGGERCDDHACDLNLIAGYEKDLREIQAAFDRGIARDRGRYQRRTASTDRRDTVVL